MRLSVFLLATSAVLAQAPAGTPQASQPQANPQAGRGGRGNGRSFLISRDRPDPAAVERGQKLFVASCGFCHGTNANGGENGPDLIRSPLALDDEGGDKIGPVVLNGRPDQGMPKFNLTQAQIVDIASFLRQRQQAAIDRGAYAILNIVTGDAAVGKAYFDGAGGCSGCHSPTGDLAGIANKYDPVALQSRFLYPTPRRSGGRGGPPRQQDLRSAKTATVTLPSGEKYSGTLEYLDDFDVAIRDSSGDYRSFTRNTGVKVDVSDPLGAHAELLAKYSDADMHNILAYLETLK